MNIMNMVKSSMRLFKRTNSTWYVEIKRGVWRSLKTKDEREARLRFKALEREALLGKLIILDKIHSVTLEEFCKEYVACLEKNRIEIRQIKAAFSKAAQWKLIKENPLKGFQQIKYHNDPPKFLNTEDIQKVFDVIGQNKRYRLVFALYVYTGAKRDEINKLTWADIKNDSILFRGKGYRTRTVPIHLRLKVILKEYHSGVGRLFNVTREQMSKQIKHYLREAGVGHIRPHDLRHTFASQLVMEGVDLRTVQELLGHSSFTTTLIYAHLTQ